MPFFHVEIAKGFVMLALVCFFAWFWHDWLAAAKRPKDANPVFLINFLREFIYNYLIALKFEQFFSLILVLDTEYFTFDVLFQK